MLKIALNWKLSSFVSMRRFTRWTKELNIYLSDQLLSWVPLLDRQLSIFMYCNPMYRVSLIHCAGYSSVVSLITSRVSRVIWSTPILTFFPLTFIFLFLRRALYSLGKLIIHPLQAGYGHNHSLSHSVLKCFCNKLFSIYFLLLYNYLRKSPNESEIKNIPLNGTCSGFHVFVFKLNFGKINPVKLVCRVHASFF